MLNIQNLLGQMMSSTNPMQMMMNLLNPQQKQAVNQFKNQSNQEQAEKIAKLANEKGLTKQDLANIINALKGKNS